jgi:hypothetical protein
MRFGSEEARVIGGLGKIYLCGGRGCRLVGKMCRVVEEIKDNAEAQRTLRFAED